MLKKRNPSFDELVKSLKNRHSRVSHDGMAENQQEAVLKIPALFSGAGIRRVKREIAR
ncbi:hypothetical protein [Desulfonema ishimotonii]|uniref:hypothetical protein n=1 Tax=Desulfonema ishimotonii TaxID=45657 RepID=UPI00140BA678|nr:hypothetical protein [Desulfonema ishimotonii]